MINTFTRRRWTVLALLSLLALGTVAFGPRALRWAWHHRRRLHLHSAQWIEFHEDTPKPIATSLQQQNGFVLFKRSILERIYPNSRPRPAEMVSSVTLHAALGEYEPVQIAVYPLRGLHGMQVTVSDLTDRAQHVIPSSAVTVRMVRYYGAPLSIRVGNRFGVVPKTLEIAVPLDLRRETVRPFWITVHVPENQPGGLYEGSVTFAHAAGKETLLFSVDVLPVQLDEPDILYGTLCMNVLANVWKWRHAGRLLRQADLIFRDQKEHGMNTISLRSVAVYDEMDGSPYLPDLEAAIGLYKKYQFTKPLVYCPGQLFKTNKINRSNNYRQYHPSEHLPMAQKVAAYYTQAFRDAGLPGPMFIAVEEPNLKSGIDASDAADIRQQMAHELTKAIKQSGALTALTCTPESVHCAIDDLDYWIVAFKRFTPALYDMTKQAHAHLCIYANGTMMGQGTYFTRFLFGYFVWANGLQGMLPWTYPMQPKRFPKNVGNKGEGALHLTDGFLGLDGRPVPTIQWELSREGIDDVKYLTTIERLAREARATGAPARVAVADDAERFLASLRAGIKRDVRHYAFEDEHTFEPQPVDDWNSEKFEATRERSVEILKTLLH